MNKDANYFAIIPGAVRYDMRLKPLDKLLFAELTALSYKEGYAWASNNYFAELFAVSISTIKRCITRLNATGHIKSVIDRKQTDKAERKIYIITSIQPKVTESK